MPNQRRVLSFVPFLAAHVPAGVALEDHLADVLPYGFPSLENVIVRQGYVAGASFERRVPAWVAERLVLGREVADAADPGEASPDEVSFKTDKSGRKLVSRKGFRFKSDPDVPTQFRCTPADYSDTGYARGHMVRPERDRILSVVLAPSTSLLLPPSISAPPFPRQATAASHNHAATEMHETFYLSSNIVPQNAWMNGGDWAKLERLTRLLPRHFGKVRVVSGPMFAPRDKDGHMVVEYETIGKHSVAVPTHLFKIIYLEEPLSRSPGESLHAVFHGKVLQGVGRLRVGADGRSVVPAPHRLPPSSSSSSSSGGEGSDTDDADAEVCPTSRADIAPLDGYDVGNDNEPAPGGRRSASSQATSPPPANATSKALTVYRPSPPPAVWSGQGATSGGDREVLVAAFVVPNTAGANEKPLWTYVSTLETVERATGLTLTPGGTPYPAAGRNEGGGVRLGSLLMRTTNDFVI